MDLTPDLLLEAKFNPARRGYDMNEVDDFLERCAEGLDVLLTRVRNEYERAERAERAIGDLRSQLVEANAAAAAARSATAAAPAPAPVEVEEVAPKPEPVEPSPEAVQEPMRILIAAERTAEATVAEARTEAERIRAEAQAEAESSRTEAAEILATTRAEAEEGAKRTFEEARRAAEVEVATLREDRDALDADVRALRRWLDDQRSRLRTAARDLQRLVDDPAALRDLPRPALTGSSGPSPSGGSPVEETPTGELEVEVDPSDAYDPGATDGDPTRSVPTVKGRPVPVIDDPEGRRTYDPGAQR